MTRSRAGGALVPSKAPLSKVKDRVDPIGGRCTLSCGHTVDHPAIFGRCARQSHRCLECAGLTPSAQRAIAAVVGGEPLPEPMPANVVPMRPRR